jgi:CRP-like cAMP-binding protein
MEIASAHLFTGLQRDEISAILGAATRRKFGPSELIIRAEEPASQLFLITSGDVNYFVVTSHGAEILLGRLVPGDIFGVGAFLSDGVGYLGTAKPVHSTETLIWEWRAVLQLAKAYPRLAENALRATLSYIAIYAKRIGLASGTAADRLASVLTDLASRAGHAVPSGVEVEITNQDLASLADVSFFTASRVLKRWERDRTLEKSRGKVLIRCPEKLLS